MGEFIDGQPVLIQMQPGTPSKASTVSLGVKWLIN